MTRILVIAPHPDDEVLGVGGTMARLVREGHDVYAAIVTRGDPSMFDAASVEQTREEARAAHKRLGIHETIFLEGLPAALLDTVPHARLNEALTELLNTVRPDYLFIPFAGDLHRDHRLVFESALVAARPTGSSLVQAIYAYETLSETNWFAPPLTPGFVPNSYVDISMVLDVKLDAMRAYQSQLKSFPHERSLEAVEALARCRGAAVGVPAAEAFVLVRRVVSVGGVGL
ncbi:MAG: PIG-L deacetylase family protein [Acidobacteriota bacterium]|nr:PIG-L family deacetylase [Blastocatellia bacterium]MDW8238655.1 PIG-L deacetylase family protein [Acidobacteriota bacterium]